MNTPYRMVLAVPGSREAIDAALPPEPSPTHPDAVALGLLRREIRHALGDAIWYGSHNRPHAAEDCVRQAGAMRATFDRLVAGA